MTSIREALAKSVLADGLALVALALVAIRPDDWPAVGALATCAVWSAWSHGWRVWLARSAGYDAAIKDLGARVARLANKLGVPQ